MAVNYFGHLFFLRLQALPSVYLLTGGTSSFLVSLRGIGTLTGSLSAVAAGRVPFESVACSLAPGWSQLGVQREPATVAFASWVDNYYAFGSSCENAVEIAAQFENGSLQS